MSDKNKCQQNIETTKKRNESHNKQQLSDYKLTNKYFQYEFVFNMIPFSKNQKPKTKWKSQNKEYSS